MSDELKKMYIVLKIKSSLEKKKQNNKTEVEVITAALAEQQH